jgi:hypothetical protein
MKVNSRYHAEAVLPPEKEPPIETGWNAGWSAEPVWTLFIGKKKLHASPPGIEGG